MSMRPAFMVAAIIVVAATVGCVPDKDEKPTAFLTPVALTEAPLSNNPEIVLINENTTCVTNSYESQVHCRDRQGAVVGVFGRRGEGPGEFRWSPSIFRGPDGTVGVISSTRLMFFEPTGILLSEKTLPLVIVGPKRWGKAIFGYGVSIVPTDFRSRGLTPAGVDMVSGEVIWKREDIHDVAETECKEVDEGRPIPSGGYVFVACQRELVFLASLDASTATVIKAPTYVDELPNERDMADKAQDTIPRGRAGFFIPASYVEEYRKTPKKAHLLSGALSYDAWERLWVATQRNLDDNSYLDIYTGTEYAGTVQIRDRLIGYDLMGPTFVALVERKPGIDGIAQRAIDWYDIGDLEIGLPTRE